MAAMGDAIQAVEFDLVGPPVKPVAAAAPLYRLRVEHRLREANAAVFIAEQAGAPIGYVLGRIEEEGDPFVDEDFSRHALIEDLYVAAAFRGRGVGRALIDAFASAMSAKGATWLRIVSKSKNRTAIDTYLACGFEAYETSFARRLR